MTDRGYARISLDNERSGSIGKQKDGIAKHGGSNVVFYVDESVSGSKIAFGVRPEGKRLLDDLQAGDRVLVTKIDRAARNVRDLLDLVEFIDSKGASIVFVDQNIDTSGPFGKFILTLLGAIAELEANIIGERRKESLAVFAKEGRHAVGAAPFGFMSVDNPNGRGLVIRPDWRERANGNLPPAMTLRDAIDRVLAGESYTTILEDLGIPLKKAGLSVLLRNPRLAGMTPDGDGVVTIDGIPRVDPDAALLSMAEWSKLRAHMKRPEKKPWAHQDGYGAALTCSECGMRLYKSVGGASRPNNNAYKCGRAKHSKGEASASVMVHSADPYIEKAFLDGFGDRDIVIVVASSSEDTRLEAVSAAQVHMEEAQRRFAVAETDEDADAALEGQRAARTALKEAQAIPVETEFSTSKSGETVAERWEQSTDAERCRMLTLVGKWNVHPGRLPLDSKIILDEDTLLTELLTHKLGSESVQYDDDNGFLLPATP